MKKLRATEVFTPSEYPNHTYVKRDDDKLETRLRDALETPGEIVSVSGPSKSGKTVLIERVVGKDNLITLTGAGIQSPETIWDRVLTWIGLPESTSVTGTVSGTIGAKGSATASGGIPIIASGSATGEISAGGTLARQSTRTSTRGGMQQVVKEIASSSFVLLLDDFHYMDRSIQSEVAKQLKEAARLGVKICTASVPHRADDVVRGNPELRGRVRAVDLDYWSADDLSKIPTAGFPLLGARIDNATIAAYARESSGSPQLMQALCLQTCFALSLRETLGETREFTCDPSLRKDVYEETSTRTDFSSLVHALHDGPRTRGTERKEFPLKDGSVGDVYRTTLLAISSDPPILHLNYNELYARISAAVTGGATPQAASIYGACDQMSKIAGDMYPSQRIVEWDSEQSVLDIVDPYFLFYLRWSTKLGVLGKNGD